MPLAPGTRVGIYEVIALLGAGGMGEVYRARDPRLQRDVALKILPEACSGDPDRLARFQREAQVLASLKHPNIGAIYGLEEGPAEGGHCGCALVLELVEGPTLAERIASGPLPLDEAVPIARQIAEALEAAHDHGIIHRDLKPANVKVCADGTVKVLDFGLAKVFETETGPPGHMNATGSPTLSLAGTRVGVILGTAAYMSPEQAKAKPADKRSDVWAFGCVLYEMLTGRRAFEGDDVSDTLAAVLRGEPDWSALPADAPAYLRTLLRRCLQKDPRKRLPHIGVARLELDEGATVGAAAAPAPGETAGGPRVAARAAPLPTRRVAGIAGVAAAIGVLGTTAMAWLLMAPPAPAAGPVRFTIAPPATAAFNLNGFYRNLAISPDGTRIAYVAGSFDQLMVRAVDQLDATAMPGITGIGSPFFSPDGRWIAYFTGGAVGVGELKKVSVAGGPPITLCRYPGNARGGAWRADDTIVFATNDPATGLMTVPAGGGEPTVLTKSDAAKGESDHLFPSLLPGSQAVLFTITATEGTVGNAQVAALDLTTGQWRTLVRGGGHAEYVETGHLVYGSAGVLWAVGFDVNRLAVTSDPEPVVDQVTTLGTSAALFAVSRQGTLVFVPGRGEVTQSRSLVWVDRQGREEAIALPQRSYTRVRLSPDATRLALEVADQENDVWIWDLRRTTLTRLTFAPETEQLPIWAPDGLRVVYSSFRDGAVGNLYSQAADGTGTVERLTTSTSAQFANSFSPDGKTLVVAERSDLALLGMDGPRQTRRIVQSAFIESQGEISPDGRWLAFQSNESGPFEVYVRPFPNVEEGRWQISSGGGSRPAWTRSGRELVYQTGDGSMMAVPVQTTPTFSAGRPSKLFDGPWFAGNITYRNYDVTRDGQRFLMIRGLGTTTSAALAPTITVVLNWSEELKRRVPTR